jgi:hypothetical protein
MHFTLKALIILSFRAERSGDPESSAFDLDSYWTPVYAGVTVYFLCS